MRQSLHTTEADVQSEELEALRGFGWEFVARRDMNTLRGPARMNEAIVEPLLVQGIRNLNPAVDEPTACEVAAQVRRITSDREMLAVLRKGIPYKPAPDQPTVDVAIVDALHPERNSYVVTEELSLRTGGQREPRLDVVCLVNGLPLGVIENKDIDEPLDAAAGDWAGYWADMPQLVAQTSIVGCCNGLRLRVGPSGAEELDRYHDWSDPWPHEVEDTGDEMLVGLTAFHPHTLVDLAVNFLIFETREGITTKKLARAHQCRATNKLVDRVVAGKLDRGIIWHATGSGKSLTMVFAARKLQRVGLGDPTVLLVIDRTELDEQINETLTACEFDGVYRPRNRAELAKLLRAGNGGVIVTTAHKFDASMAGLLSSGEVIAFVDEAHRTQFGDFGIFMRAAVPNARLFGFTGTPIEAGGRANERVATRSTRRIFSPQLDDGSYEPYLDRYGFDQAIADGATVPVAYEPRLHGWRLTRTDLDARFDALTAGMPEEERDALRQHAVVEKVVAKAPDRVAAIAADVAEQLRDRIAPNGFGGLFAAVDREACAQMAQALAVYLQPDEYAVVMSRSKKDSTPHAGHVDLRDWYPAVQWERVHGRPPDVEADEGDLPETDGRALPDAGDEFSAPADRAAIKDSIKRLKSDNDPLTLLIVNAMLLTGFDAPPVQVLFLDRGLRAHTLMQAIARTNRRYPGKDMGLVLDYWGVFDDLKGALREFAAEDLTGLLEDTDSLIARLPELLNKALSIVAGAPSGSARRRMLWVVRYLTDHSKEAERFEDLVRDAQSVYETLSPDPRLLAHIPRYRELMEVWAAWQRGTRRDRRGSAQMRRKTQELVQESIGFDRLRSELPAAIIDAEFLAALHEDKTLTPEEKATDIEAALVHEVKVRGEDDPRGRALAERLVRLRRRREREAQMTLVGLQEWEGLVRDYVAEDEEAESLGLDAPGALTHAVLRNAAPGVADEQLVAVARDMSVRYSETAGFAGWSQRPDVVQGLRRAAITELVAHPDTRRLARDAQVVDDLLAALATIDRPRAS